VSGRESFSLILLLHVSARPLPYSVTTCKVQSGYPSSLHLKHFSSLDTQCRHQYNAQRLIKVFASLCLTECSAKQTLSQMRVPSALTAVRVSYLLLREGRTGRRASRNVARGRRRQATGCIEQHGCVCGRGSVASTLRQWHEAVNSLRERVFVRQMC
jgi:hypothetical protein